MHALWHWILWCLAAWSHDPATLDRERARCVGAVNVAYAALAQEQATPPKREPPADSRPAVKPVPDLPPLPPAAPCLQCSGTGRIYRSDGGWVKCPCQCPDGKCKPTKVLP